MLKNNAIYVCSEDERATTNQIELLKAKINSNTDILVYSDNTLDDNNKTGYVSLIMDIQFNKIDKLFVANLESLTTNVQKLAAFCKILDKFDVELIVLNTSISNTPIKIQTVADTVPNSQKITIDDWDDDDGLNDDVVEAILDKMITK